MTKNTPRDRVWGAALDLADERRDSSTYRHRRSFSASEVRARVEDPPSQRTVRDVLATMADLGRLERARKRGEYEPAEVSFDGAGEAEESFLEDDVVDEEAGDEIDIAASGLSEPASEDVDEDPLEAALAVADEADVPGYGGDVVAARRAALRAVVERLDEGPATRRDLEAVQEDQPAEYETTASWWKNLVHPFLRNLRDADLAAYADRGDDRGQYRLAD